MVFREIFFLTLSEKNVLSKRECRHSVTGCRWGEAFSSENCRDHCWLHKASPPSFEVFVRKVGPSLITVFGKHAEIDIYNLTIIIIIVSFLPGTKWDSTETAAQRNGWHEENESETDASNAWRGGAQQEDGEQIEPTDGERVERKP